MKRHGLTCVTLLTLALTGGVLSRAGWLTRDARGATGGQTEVISLNSPHDLTSGPGLRWKHTLPNHWRACVLQR